MKTPCRDLLRSTFLSILEHVLPGENTVFESIILEILERLYGKVFCVEVLCSLINNLIVNSDALSPPASDILQYESHIYYHLASADDADLINRVAAALHKYFMGLNTSSSVKEVSGSGALWTITQTLVEYLDEVEEEIDRAVQQQVWMVVRRLALTHSTVGYNNAQRVARRFLARREDASLLETVLQEIQFSSWEDVQDGKRGIAAIISIYISNDSETRDRIETRCRELLKSNEYTPELYYLLYALGGALSTDTFNFLLDLMTDRFSVESPDENYIRYVVDPIQLAFNENNLFEGWDSDGVILSNEIVQRLLNILTSFSSLSSQEIGIVWPYANSDEMLAFFILQFPKQPRLEFRLGELIISIMLRKQVGHKVLVLLRNLYEEKYKLIPYPVEA